MTQVLIKLVPVDDTTVEELAAEAEHLLLNDHPWLPGGFFTDVKQIAVEHGDNGVTLTVAEHLPVPLSDGELKELAYCLRAKLPAPTYSGMLSTTEKRRRDLLDKVQDELKQRGV